MPRKYTKSSSYWANRTTTPSAAPAPSIKEADPFPELDYKWDGKAHYSAHAACHGGSPSYRGGGAQAIPANAYENISAGILPWQGVNGFVSMSEVAILCQLAWANVGVVRNAIEAGVEFTVSPIHFKTSNKTVQEFFNSWWNRINGISFFTQFAREYYRSGNVFIYKFVGKMGKQQYGQMKSVFGAKDDTLPIRYIIINPAQVYLQGGIAFNGNNWVKMLSTYEIERLREPKTLEDKQIYNSLPEATKIQIANGGAFYDIYIPLDPSRLYYVFYKKQDYEPWAVPMVFPVLNDVEFKLQLKKMDMSLARTVEQVILLITTGQKNDEWNKNGVNPANLAHLNNIFSNQTIGRVLVADYTTKGEWLIPDIGQIIGPEKYKQVEHDIREGLQTIFGADEKFANAAMKAKVFVERMKEGQRAFLNNFLVPEVQKICEQMGFRDTPVVECETISLDDQTNLHRIYVRMAELGLLTADEVKEAIQTGLLPDNTSSLMNQEVYKKERDKGLYMPLIGGADPAEEAGRPAGTKAPQTTKKVSPIGTSKAAQFSTKTLIDLLPRANALRDDVRVAACKQFKCKAESLTTEQNMVVEALAKSIIVNENPETWTAVIKDYLKAPKDIAAEMGRDLDDIAATHDLDSWTAAIMYRCKI